MYQGKVHQFVETFLKIKFSSEVSLRSIVKIKFVTTTNDQGIKEKIILHQNIRLDGYRELSKSVKKYLGLDDKWIGIAFEAQSEYYHKNPNQIERDRRKKLVCEEKNILLLEIWDNWDLSSWGAHILDQIKVKTGVKIPLSKLGGLAKFLDINLDSWL